MKKPIVEGLKPIFKEKIPCIPLYMDQVTGYLEKALSPLKVKKDHKVLTKTMINNYVKAGVIDKPEKKKYSVEQTMALIMIYQLKNVLSLREISLLFRKKKKNKSTHDQEEKEALDISGWYDLFVGAQEKVYESLQKELPDEEKIDDLTLMEMALKADIYKRVLEREIGKKEDIKKST